MPVRAPSTPSEQFFGQCLAVVTESDIRWRACLIADWPSNGGVCGMWHDNSRCINCMASRRIAPGLIEEKDGRSTFVRQPATQGELLAAWRAVLISPMALADAPSLLAWSFATNSLRAFSNFCWYDRPTRLQSLPRLSEETLYWARRARGFSKPDVRSKDDRGRIGGKADLRTSRAQGRNAPIPVILARRPAHRKRTFRAERVWRGWMTADPCGLALAESRAISLFPKCHLIGGRLVQCSSSAASRSARVSQKSSFSGSRAVFRRS